MRLLRAYPKCADCEGGGGRARRTGTKTYGGRVAELMNTYVPVMHFSQNHFASRRDKSLSTQGSITCPKKKPYPVLLKPWTDFPILQQQLFEFFRNAYHKTQYSLAAPNTSQSSGKTFATDHWQTRNLWINENHRIHICLVYRTMRKRCVTSGASSCSCPRKLCKGLYSSLLQGLIDVSEERQECTRVL